jgi:hypothetical protein
MSARGAKRDVPRWSLKTARASRPPMLLVQPLAHGERIILVIEEVTDDH